MNFSIRLKALRENKKISQRKLAGLIKIAPSTLAMYEVGKREPDFNTLKIFADFFEVTTDYLLGHTDDPKIPLSLKDKVFNPNYKPTEVDLEELLKSSKVRFQGNILATEDKEKLLRIAELLWEERRKTELERQK